MHKVPSLPPHEGQGGSLFFRRLLEGLRLREAATEAPGEFVADSGELRATDCTAVFHLPQGQAALTEVTAGCTQTQLPTGPGAPQLSRCRAGWHVQALRQVPEPNVPLCAGHWRLP